MIQRVHCGETFWQALKRKIFGNGPCMSWDEYLEITKPEWYVRRKNFKLIIGEKKK